MRKARFVTGYAYLTKKEVQEAVKTWLYDEHALAIKSVNDVDVDDGGATVTLWTVEEDYHSGANPRKDDGKTTD